MVAKLGDSASENGQKNVAFLSYFVLGKLEDCLETLISTNRRVGFGLGSDDNFNGDLMTIPMTISMTMMVSTTNLDDEDNNFNRDLLDDNNLDAVNGDDNVIGDFHGDCNDNLNDQKCKELKERQ